MEEDEEDEEDDDDEDEDEEDEEDEEEEEDQDDDDDDDDDEDDDDEGRNSKRQKTNKDINKLKDYFKNYQPQNVSSLTSKIETFRDMSKDEQGKILKTVDENSNAKHMHLMYKVMLSNIPQPYKNDIIEKIHSIGDCESHHIKYREYVKNLLKIPFGKYKTSDSDKKDITKRLNDVLESMNECIWGHEEAKEKIMQYIAQTISNPESNGLVLGLEGPMGNGKTTLIEKGFSKAMQRPFISIPLGGCQDASYLEGHGYTYEGSKCGMIANAIIKAKVMNPVIYFDELDKVSDTPKGREIINLLIHLIDPSQNTHFHDKYFSDVDIDLSKCIFMFSFNDRYAINPILLDRIKVIKTNGFSIKQKQVIVKNYIMPNILKDVGVEDGNIIISEDIVHYLIETFTLESGVRSIKKLIYDIVRFVNLKHLLGTASYPLHVTKDLCKNEIFKNKEEISHKFIHHNDEIGKINGLYATNAGYGGITQIEMNFIPSKEQFLELKLTGNQGKVMKESMEVAKTNAWNLLSKKRQQELLKYWEKNKNQGIHIHCPEGATEKDGPSAGTAITIAIYSLLANIKIKHNFAITGEIDLSGNVLEIGGLQSKLFGAKKAGCNTVIIPKENEKTLQKIVREHPDLIDEKFNVIPVSKVQDVQKLILV